METDADVLGKYRNISNKLKKKFLRKPNVSEGSEQFGSLARSLREQECPQYAAFVCLAQASKNHGIMVAEDQAKYKGIGDGKVWDVALRCEHTLGNPPGEAQALIEAARGFLEAQMANEQLNCPNFEEHLNAAINCFSHAIRVYVEKKQPALAANLCLELGNALKTLNRSSEAIAHYQRAAQLYSFSLLDCLSALGMMASCKVDIADYEGALTTLTEMSSLIMDKSQLTGGSRPIGAYADILAQCEVTRVLLLLLLQPTPQRLGQEHAKTLEKYTWDSTDEESPINYLQEHFFLLLQSVVLACQSKDGEAIKSLQVELWPLLTTEQNQLLNNIVNNVLKPPGDGYN